MWRRHPKRQGFRGSSWGFCPPRVSGDPRRSDIDAVWRGGRVDARRRGTVVPNLSPQLKVDDFESVEAREPEMWHRRRGSSEEFGGPCTDRRRSATLEVLRRLPALPRDVEVKTVEGERRDERG